MVRMSKGIRLVLAPIIGREGWVVNVGEVGGWLAGNHPHPNLPPSRGRGGEWDGGWVPACARTGGGWDGWFANHPCKEVMGGRGDAC